MAALPRLDHALVRSGALDGHPTLAVPDARLLDLPERVVQFGTGAFLRGFVDAFVDAANRQGRFDGRIVAVGSTGSGRDRVLNEQDGLYTLVARGTADGRVVEERRVIASVSRALSAADAWDAVLACARRPELALVVSNTTEVGIALDEGDGPALSPPRSFPGKLARFLLERARAFDFDPAHGVVVLPCELIEDNGDRLRDVVHALAARWRVEPAFARWLDAAVPVCNTLVDRIVPGAPAPDEAERLQRALGYADAMLTTCEPYRLFAIEGDDALRARLPVAGADPGIVVADDAGPYRERKVRLLNGGHTASVPVALLCGLETVREAMEDPLVGAFVRRLVLDEIAPTVAAPDAAAFGRDVLDRFANPFIRHALFDITLQGTTKLRVRVVPTILRHAARTGAAPPGLALGLAAHLLLLRGDLQARRRAAGLPVPPDDLGAALRARWDALPRDDDAALRALARGACADAALWGTDLAAVPGLADAVGAHLVRAARGGMRAALAAHLEDAACR